MQDVDVRPGIQTNNWVLSWDTDVNLFTPSAGGSAGAAGTGIETLVVVQLRM